MKTYFVDGQWNVLCDMCGFKYKSGMLKKNWRGLMVCKACFETRNPQDFIKVRPEKIAPPWVRPQGEDRYIAICYLWGISGYADLAVADCMVAENNTFPADFLSNLQQGIG